MSQGVDGFVPNVAVAGDDDEADGERDDGANEGGDGAAFRDEGAWNLDEAKQEDDVAGDGGGEERVVDVDDAERDPGEEGGEGGDGDEVRMHVGEAEGDDGRAGDGAESARECAVDRVRNGGPENDERGHGNPVAAGVVELAVYFSAECEHEGQAQGIGYGGVEDAALLDGVGCIEDESA